MKLLRNVWSTLKQGWIWVLIPAVLLIGMEVVFRIVLKEAYYCRPFWGQYNWVLLVIALIVLFFLGLRKSLTWSFLYFCFLLVLAAVAITPFKQVFGGSGWWLFFIGWLVPVAILPYKCIPDPDQDSLASDAQDLP